jgi:ferritin-like metal-binding protein YciE
MHTNEIDKHLDNWLSDAHAMEQQAKQMLQAQASRIENYPDLAARIEQHLSETRSQRRRLEACLERRGTRASGFKDAGGRFMAMMQGFGGSIAPDEVAMASYTFEHFEIASHGCLVAAAEQAGDRETARACATSCSRRRRWPAGSTTGCPTSPAHSCSGPRRSWQRPSAEVRRQAARGRRARRGTSRSTCTLRRSP